MVEDAGRIRCIARGEINNDGEHVLVDITAPMSLSQMCTLDAATDSMTASAYNRTLQQLQGKACDMIDDEEVPCTTLLHRYYCSPGQPFQGMFFTTRQQLQDYMNSSLWDREGAMKSTTVSWGHVERSSSLFVMLHRPEGCPSNCMVPYWNVNKEGEPRKVQLSKLVLVDHLGNRYAAMPQNPHGKLSFEGALRP